MATEFNISTSADALIVVTGGDVCVSDEGTEDWAGKRGVSPVVTMTIGPVGVATEVGGSDN